MEETSLTPRVSVVIPTYNGEEHLDEVLAAVFRQKTDFSYEVIIIDSYSMDRTKEIVEAYMSKAPGLSLIEIAPAEFNHGETRNLGVRKARGEFVAFLTQDATPASDNWLQSLVGAFSLDPKVAGVFGKHIPRPDCNPCTARDVEGVFRSFGAEGDRPVIQEALPGSEEHKLLQNNEGFVGFYSDVNSALRRSAWEKVPYRKIQYAEDQLFGKDILEAGYKKAYVPAAAVYHSHNYPVRLFFRRFFDEYRGLNLALGYVDGVRLLNLIPQTLRGTLGDAAYIARCSKYGPAKKLYWSWYALWMNLIRRIAAYLGGRHDRIPRLVANLLSLEAGGSGKGVATTQSTQ